MVGITRVYHGGCITRVYHGGYMPQGVPRWVYATGCTSGCVTGYTSGCVTGYTSGLWALTWV